MKLFFKEQSKKEHYNRKENELKVVSGKLPKKEGRYELFKVSGFVKLDFT